VYGSAATGAPRSLTDLGIKIGADNFSFELSDESKLTSAMEDNFEGVADMLNHVLGKVETRIAAYVDGTDAIIESTKESNDDRIDLLKDQISSYESRLTRREETLRKQFYELQAQIINMNYQFQSTQAAMFGSFNINQQG